MEIKEVVLQKGYQVIFTEEEWSSLWFYFHDKWNHEVIRVAEMDQFEKDMFNKLENYRLAKL